MIFAYQCTICIRKKVHKTGPCLPLVWSLPCSNATAARACQAGFFLVFFCFPCYRGVGRGEGGRIPPPIFGRSVNPISTSGGGAFVRHITKGQIIWKANCQAENEQTNSFLLLCDVFLFVFWKRLKRHKRHFEIN